MPKVDIEGLETRRLLSSSLDPRIEFDSHDGELSIKGSSAADTVTVAVNATDATKLDVTVDGLLHQYRIAQVKSISVDAGGGDDNVSIAPTVLINADLKGGEGADTLIGGGGRDKIDGGNGADTLTGGPGADAFKVDATDTITDFDPAVDTKTTVTPKPTPVPPPSQNVKLDGSELKIKGTSADDVVIIAIDTADGTKLDVTFNGVVSKFTLSKIRRITADMGAGADKVTIDAAVTIGSQLKGGDGADTLIGGGGKDIIDVAGGGTDTVTGGAGADYFRVDATDITTDFVAGTDTKQVVGLPPTPPPPPGPITLSNDGQLKIRGTDAADTLAVTLTGGNIVVTLNALPAVQFPATSVKSIKADMGGGDDVVTIDAAITAPADVDGGAGNDKITTGGGNDKVDGGAGDDTIDTGAGDDKIEDEQGTNKVTGGAGADSFDVNDTTTITDFDPAVDKKDDEGDDHDDDHGGPTGTTPTAVLREGRLNVEGTAGADNINVSVSTTDATKLLVVFNGGTPIVFPLALVRSIGVDAGAGDDTVLIGATVTRSAQIDGGAGNDNLTGGSGNDKIEDELGTNTVTGGAGADTFEVNATTTITDFVVGVDKKED